MKAKKTKKEKKAKVKVARRRPYPSLWLILLVAFTGVIFYNLRNEIMGYIFLPIFLISLYEFCRRLISNKLEDRLEPRLHSCRRYLRALRIKIAKGKGTPAESNEEHICKNCGKTYTGNYCSKCGQSAKTERYHTGNVFENIAGGFFNIDQGFGSTLVGLFYRPGYIIKDFIAGKRAQYFRPFQMLFVLAAIYILLFALFNGATPQKPVDESLAKTEIIEADKEVQTPTPSLEISDEQEVSAELEINDELEVSAEQDSSDSTSAFYDPIFWSETWDLIIDTFGEDSFVAFIDRSWDNTIEFVQTNSIASSVTALLKDLSQENVALRIVAMMPIMALCALLAFRKRNKVTLQYNYVEFIFSEAFISCQRMLIMTVMIPFPSMEPLITPLYALLRVISYKQLFNINIYTSFKRVILIDIYRIIILVLLATLVIILGYLVFLIFGGA